MGASQPTNADLIARLQRWLPWLVYSAVAALVLWGLLLPGYVLTLDLTFTPDIKISDYYHGFDTLVYGGLPLFLLLKGGSLVMPMWVVEKAMLFFPLLLAGLGAHYLSPAKHPVGRYFAGLLYILNPFVYARMMAGQHLVVWGYALLPFAFMALFAFLERPNLRRATILAVVYSLIGVFAAHMLAIAVIAGMVVIAVKVVRERADRRAMADLARWTGFVLLIFLVLNLYWIVPVLVNQNSVLTQIGPNDLQVFTAQSLPGSPGVLFSIASLHGFWRGGYRFISDILPWWPLLFGVVLFVSVLGFLSFARDRKLGLQTLSMGIVALIALLLGTGISLLYFGDVYRSLFDNVFLFRGLRDSQKFAALLALAYAYLGGMGVSYLLEQVNPGNALKSGAKSLALAALAIVLLLVPFLYGLNMLGGFYGDLARVDYPQEWYAANRFLDEQPGDFEVLFLPWHQYMAFQWAGRQVFLNPAKDFFHKPIIAGENIEIGPIATQSTKPEQHYIGYLLDRKPQLTRFGALVSPLNVKYVMLAKDAADQDYQFLYHQRDLRVLEDNARLAIFQNEAPLSPFYVAEREVPLQDWQAFVDAVQQGSLDPLGAAYPLGGQAQAATVGKATPAVVTQHAATRYTVDSPVDGFLVASLPYDSSWRLGGESPGKHLDLSMSFPVKAGERYTLHYSKESWLRVLYLLSLASWAGVLGYLVQGSRRGAGTGS